MAMILRADARHIPLADRSVRCVVTSPPYWGLRDYGVAGQIGLEATPEAYVATMVAVFREVRRVLKDDGTLWLNLGDSYAGSGMGRNGDGSIGRLESPKQRSNDGANFGFFNHAQGNIPGLKPKDLIGTPWRVAFALQADGWYLRSDIIWAKPNPMPESVTDRPTRSHEYIFLLAKSPKYFYDADAIRESYLESSLHRFEYQFKAHGSDHPYGAKHGAIRDGGEINANPQGRNKRDVWTINSEPTPEAHFATFPSKLVEPCILAGSRLGDVVFDPFIGSGTVGRVAERLGRRWVGLELSAEYIEIARRRTSQKGLFGWAQKNAGSAGD